MDKETGILFVLMERLEQQRLPRILSLKDKVDGGEKLNDADLDYMEKMLKDAKKIMPLIEKHPEYQLIATKLYDLYEDITDKALELEKS